jgi:hypothetical protein
VLLRHQLKKSCGKIAFLLQEKKKNFKKGPGASESHKILNIKQANNYFEYRLTQQLAGI